MSTLLKHLINLILLHLLSFCCWFNWWFLVLVFCLCMLLRNHLLVLGIVPFCLFCFHYWCSIGMVHVCMARDLACEWCCQLVFPRVLVIQGNFVVLYKLAVCVWVIWVLILRIPTTPEMVCWWWQAVVLLVVVLLQRHLMHWFLWLWYFWVLLLPRIVLIHFDQGTINQRVKGQKEPLVIQCPAVIKRIFQRRLQYSWQRWPWQCRL